MSFADIFFRLKPAPTNFTRNDPPLVLAVAIMWASTSRTVQSAHNDGVVDRSSRHVDELVAVLGSEGTGLHPPETATHGVGFDPRPVGDLGDGRGPEPVEVPRHDAGRGLVDVDVGRRPEPVLGRGVEV